MEKKVREVSVSTWMGSEENMEPHEEKWIVKLFSDEGIAHLLQEDRLTQIRIVDAVDSIWSALMVGLQRGVELLNIFISYANKPQEEGISVKFYAVDYRDFAGLKLTGPWDKDGEDIEHGLYAVELILLSDGKTLKCDRDLLSFWGRSDSIFVNHTMDKVRKAMLGMLSLRSEIFCGSEILSIVGDVDIGGMY